MQSDHKTEVLVVGAGPVGMFTALRLAQLGLQVRIIDQESRTAGHSYACALHPSSLQLLDEAGIAADAIDPGCRIDRIGFFEGAARQAELKLSDLAVEFPFVLVLPQSGLEDMLEQRLRQLPNVKFDWRHRLADLRMDADGVTAIVEKLASTGRGLIVPEFEMGVEKEIEVRADFVVGADGHGSVVRQRLGIVPERVGEPDLFVVYEIETDGALDREMKVVLDKTTASVLWPLATNRCRWSFQLFPADPPTEFRDKDRTRYIIEQRTDADRPQAHLERLLKERAPWFKAGVSKLDWCTDIQFEHWSARQFGKERGWLVGDAAHQTGPVGMHSMNLGLSEGVDLAVKLKKILRDRGSLDLLETYGRDHRAAWQKLLGATGVPAPTAKAAAWTKQNSAKILRTLPASGKDLVSLLDRLGLDFK